MQQALDEVDPNTIVRCWCKVGVHLSGEECNDADDPFAGEELLALDRLIYQVQDPTDEPDGIPPKEYINDDNVPCVQPLIDVDNNEWRKEVRNELLENFRAESNESVCERDEDPFAVDHRDDKFDLPLREPKFKWVEEVLAAVDEVAVFTEFHGNEKLVQATSNVSTLLTTMRESSLKQTTMDSFISKLEKQWRVWNGQCTLLTEGIHSQKRKTNGMNTHVI